MSNLSLKFAMMLLSIFGINAQSCLNFDHLRNKSNENNQYFAKFPISGLNVAKNFRFELLHTIFENVSLADSFADKIQVSRKTTLKDVYSYKMIFSKNVIMADF